MKLVFDARPMASQFSGLGRYTGSLLNALLSTYTDSGLDVVVLLDSQYNWCQNSHYKLLSDHVSHGRCSVHYVSAPSISLRQHLVVGKAVNSLKPDVYFYPHFDLPFGLGVKSIFVIHDLIPLIVPGYVQKYSWAKIRYFKYMIEHGVAKADQCIAVSDTTRRDILDVVGQRYSDKIHVVFEGPVLGRSGQEELLSSERSYKSPYLLYVGDRRPHKNLRRTIELFVRLKDSHGYSGDLVLVGSTQNYEYDIEMAIEGRADIRVLGNVTDAHLIDLYKHTDALIFLSEYEGFGLPVVEAASFGRRMILSDGGALSEIAPCDACILERTLSVELAAGIAAAYLSNDTPPNYTVYNERFSWEKAAKDIFPTAYN